MRDVSRHYAGRACPQTVRLITKATVVTDQASDPSKQKTHPLFRLNRWPLILLKIEILPYD